MAAKWRDFLGLRLVLEFEGRQGIIPVIIRTDATATCAVFTHSCFRPVSASRRSGPESDPWQQHDRLELLPKRHLPALWPAAQDTRTGCLVFLHVAQQGRVSADRHGSTAHCLRGSNAGGKEMAKVDHTVQTVRVTWRGYLVVLWGEQRGQGNWALQRLSLWHVALHPF